MEFKSGILIITLIAIILAGISGCVPKELGQGGEELERVEGRFHSEQWGRTLRWTYFLTFDETRFIRQIVIHPNVPIRYVDIYVHVGKDNWKLIKQIKGKVDAATPINTAVRGDAIRIVQKSVTWGLRSETGYIQGIEAFAAPK